MPLVGSIGTVAARTVLGQASARSERMIAATFSGRPHRPEVSVRTSVTAATSLCIGSRDSGGSRHRGPSGTRPRTFSPHHHQRHKHFPRAPHCTPPPPAQQQRARLNLQGKRNPAAAGKAIDQCGEASGEKQGLLPLALLALRTEEPSPCFLAASRPLVVLFCRRHSSRQLFATTPFAKSRDTSLLLLNSPRRPAQASAQGGLASAATSRTIHLTHPAKSQGLGWPLLCATTNISHHTTPIDPPAIIVIMITPT